MPIQKGNCPAWNCLFCWSNRQCRSCYKVCGFGGGVSGVVQIGPGLLCPSLPFQLPSLDWRCCWRENISSAHSLRTSYICLSLILNQSKLWRIQSNVFNLKRPKQGAKGCDLLFTWASTLPRLLHDLVKIFSNYLTIIFQHRWTNLVGQFGNLM